MKAKLLILLTGILTFCTEVTFAQTNLPKGNVSQIMNAGRIVDGKEITSVDLPFTKGQGAPFSIMLVPKNSGNTIEVEILKGRYYQGNLTVDVPVSVNQWNSTALVFIANDPANTMVFLNYRVFVGFGQQAD